MSVRLLTVADAAKALAVSDKTVRRMIRRGTIKCVRIGRAVRVDEAELEAYVNRGQGRRPPAPTPEKITDGQRRAFHAKCDDLDRSQEAQRGHSKRAALAAAAEKFDREIASTNDLLSHEASWVLDELEEQLERA